MGKSRTGNSWRERSRMTGGSRTFWSIPSGGEFDSMRRCVVSALAASVAVLILLSILAPLRTPPHASADSPVKDAGILTMSGKTYSVEGSILEPVIGASSPNDPTQGDGRLWIIVGHDTGLIELDSVKANGTSFALSTSTLSIRIQDFGLSTPISNILWLSPGRLHTGYRSYMDDLTKSGLLGFVANQYLVLMDPFQRRLLLKQYIGFQPTWFVNDPVSAGDMYDFPRMRFDPSGGEHCYHYIVAATGTHVSAYTVDYRSSQDDPVLPPGGVQQVLSVDMPVMGLPLAYYLQEQPQRSGLFIPTSNNRLRYFTLNGTREYNLTLSIDGEPANIPAPIGFSRAVERQMLYIPLKSASKTGVAYVVPTNVLSGNLTVAHTLAIYDMNAVIATSPDPANLDTPYFAVTYYQGGTSSQTGLMRGTPYGVPDYSLGANLTRQLRSFFFSPTPSQLFALDVDGTVWYVKTTAGQGANDFFLDSASERTHLLYMGSWTGARYATLVSPTEVLGFVFEPIAGAATVFQLNEPVTPPPGPPAQDVRNLVIPVALAVLAAITVSATWFLTKPRRKEPA